MLSEVRIYKMVFKIKTLKAGKKNLAILCICLTLSYCTEFILWHTHNWLSLDFSSPQVH